MERLRAYPEIGRGETYLPGLRSHVVNRHVVYYVHDETAVRVLRLLHVRMDAASHFPS